MRRFEGRVAVVTGAGSGIGEALARQLAERGTDLALVDLKPDALNRTAEAVKAAGRRCSVHVGDVSERGFMAGLPEEVIDVHQHVHMLFNNAGVSVLERFRDQSLDDWDWIMGINFHGVLYGCHFFLPHLLKEDEAHIVNVSSMFGFAGFPQNSAYCATKAAVRALGEALYAELAPTNVGLTNVHPGGIATGIVETSRASDEAQRKLMEQRIARMGRPPAFAARKILRAVERGTPRLRICIESYLTDWLVRLSPTLVMRLNAWSERRVARG